MKHKMEVLNRSGHGVIEWDSEVGEEIKIADAEFKKLIAEGYAPVEVKNGEGQRMHGAFDPENDYVMLAPIVGG